MATLYNPSVVQPQNSSGVPLAGAKLFFYQTGTTTEITVYQDDDLSSPRTNPVISSASGIFPPIYLRETEFKVVLKDASDVTIQTVDPAYGTVSGSSITGASGLFATRTEATNSSLVSAPDYIRTAGYSAAGDGGGALYKKVASEPSHAGKFSITLSDGSTVVWYELADDQVSVNALGAFAGSTVDTEMTNAIAAAAGTGKPLYIPGGTYSFLSEVDFSDLDNVILGGKVVFDFTSATAAANFPDDAFVYVAGDALTALPDLSSSPSKGDATLTFATDPSLSNGDYFCIYNPTGGSYSGHNTAYHAGEWCRVYDGSGGTTVDLYGALYAGYTAANVDLYKHPGKTFEIGGGTLTILESENANLVAVAGFRADRIVDSDFSAIHPTNSGNAGMSLVQCIGTHGTGYNCRQSRRASVGTYYGLVYANCQDIDIQGYFFGGNHGVTGGGFDTVGSVVNRNVVIRGTFKNSADSPLTAAGFHGNCEYCHYHGDLYGGVIVAGDFNKVSGRLYSNGSTSPVPIIFTEMKGWSHDLSGCYVYAAGDPGPIRAIVDIGADNINVANANTDRGGHLNLDGIEFDCPATTRLITIQNRGSAPSDEIVVTTRNARWAKTSGSSPVALIWNTVSGNNLDVWDMRGFENGPDANYSMAAVVAIRGWQKAGTVTISPLTSASVVTTAAPINAPRTPKATATMQGPTAGGTQASADIASKSPSSLGISVATADGAVFPSTATVDVDWIAVVEE